MATKTKPKPPKTSIMQDSIELSGMGRLSGSFDEVITYLHELKSDYTRDKYNYTDIVFYESGSSYSKGCLITLEFWREETDAEYEKRMVKLEKEKAKKKSLDDKAKEQRRKEYEKLKKEFE